MNVQMDTFNSYLVPEVRRKQFNKGVKVHHIIILSTSSTQLQKKGRLLGIQEVFFVQRDSYYYPVLQVPTKETPSNVLASTPAKQEQLSLKNILNISVQSMR